MTQKSDLTILVLSCDKYQDLWNPFFGQLKKFWADCPYEIVLGSNTRRYSSVKTLLSGPDKDWSSSLLRILSQVKTPYVFIWLDDIFPISRVNQTVFDDTVSFMKKHEAKHIHIYKVPKPDILLSGEKYGEYIKGAPYRATALGFWDVKYLVKLLLPGESPWNFEVMGSYRTSFSDGFFCSMQPLFDWLHIVEKGKIFREAYNYCRSHDIPLEYSKREIIKDTSFVKSQLQKYYFNLVIRLPWNIRLAVMNALRKLLISY